jgi:DNA-binding MarR family transcriptional regulator
LRADRLKFNKISPVGIEDECAKNILEVSPRIVHFIRTEARNSSGLTISQFRILARLSHSTTTNSELADRQGISLPTVSRTVEGLVQRGLISRSRDTGNDRRQNQLDLTKKGRGIFEKIMQTTQSKLHSKLQTLSLSEKQKIRDSFQLLSQLFF